MTHPSQRESLQEWAEQSKQRLRAMPQVAHTGQLDEVIPSASVESKGVSIFRCVLPSARRSLSFTLSTVER